MPGYERPLFVDEHRDGEAKFADRGGDSRYLFGRMRAGIAGIGNQPIDRPALNLICGHAPSRASARPRLYGIGNLGKVIGPLGLALIVGSSEYVSPKVTADAIFPALLFLAFWYGQAGLVFLFLAEETKGRSIEEIGSTFDAQADAPAGVRAPAV